MKGAQTTTPSPTTALSMSLAAKPKASDRLSKTIATLCSKFPHHRHFKHSICPTPAPSYLPNDLPTPITKSHIPNRKTFNSLRNNCALWHSLIECTMQNIALWGGAYLIGSIPFGLILAHIMHKKDVRQHGSGNIGATNVVRTAGKLCGLLTLIFDVAKGYIAVHYGMADGSADWAGICVLCGHMFPVWLRFRGGKGVATFLGVLLACNVYIAVIALCAWVGFLTITRISALASLLSVVTTHAMIWLWGLNVHMTQTTLFVFTTLIIFQHRQNIQRLLADAHHPSPRQRKKEKGK